MPDGATVLTTRDGEPVLSYCAIGTMGGAAVVPEAAAIPMPDGVDPAVAALIGCCVSTGVGAVVNTAEVPAGASVAVIGLGGVGLSCVMGAALAGASRIFAIDRVEAKLAVERSVGAKDGILASSDRGETIATLRDMTDGGPDFVFEAIGRVETVELAIEALPLGGTGPRGMIRGARLPRSTLRFQSADPGSNYGFADPSVDSRGRGSTHGRLPIDQLIDRRIGLDDVEDAFDRPGPVTAAPGRRLD